MSTQNVENKKKPFDLEKIASSLSAGLISGIMAVLVSVSFAALIFSGELSDYVSSGIGLFLVGAFVAGLVSVLTSSFYGSITIPQDTPAVLIATEVAALSSVVLASGSRDDLFLVAITIIIFTSLLTSFSFFIMGLFDLGSVIRYLPYPVIGGFLAGTGWLLFKGAFGMIDVPFDLFHLNSLFADGSWVRWVPMLLLGIFLFIVTNRIQHFLTLPILFFGAVALFYIFLAIFGVPFQQASADGWLLGPFPDGDLFQFLALDAIQADGWQYIVSDMSNMGAIVIISVISMLLNISGIEFSASEDIDMKKEMTSVGLANLAAGAVGSLISYPSLALSLLSNRIAPRSRLTGVFSAIFVGLTLFFGIPLLSVFPKAVLGGLILFFGLNFIYEWLIQTYSKMPLIEYLVIWVVLVAINFLGILEGVGIGLLLALILFVVNYSQIDIVKHTLSAKNYRSTVDRDSVYTRALKNRGNYMRILELQGYIFFGTANALLEHVRELIKEDFKDELKFLILSFRHVSGIDASATQSFLKLLQTCKKQNIQILFVSMSQEIYYLLEREVKVQENEAQWRVFENRDYAVEWCEDEMIRVYKDAGLSQATRPANKRLTVSSGRKDRLSGLMNYLEDRNDEVAAEVEEKEKTLIERLHPYMDYREVSQGDLIIKEGDRVQGLHFIEGGIARVEIHDSNDNPIRLRKMQKGSVVGEISLYSRGRSTANVIAEEACDIYFLPKVKIKQIEKDDLALANELHKFLAELLGFRTASATDTIRALLD